MASKDDMKKRLRNSDQDILCVMFGQALDKQCEDLDEAAAKALRKERGTVAARKRGDKPSVGSVVTLAEDLFKGTEAADLGPGVVTSLPEWGNDLGAGPNAVIVAFERSIGRTKHFLVRPGFIGTIETPEVEAEEAQTETQAETAAA